MAFTRKTEIRQISRAELMKIAEILNQPSNRPAWKKLMQIVPKEFTHPEHLSESEQKYTTHHINAIEQASVSLRRPAAQIFLDEWITSGRIRPTLSHLLQLLIESESYRAADYVAVNLLSEARPQRPSRGPAASIDVTLPEDDVTDARTLNGNSSNSTDNENLNKVHSKDIPNKNIFNGRPMSEEDLIRFSAIGEDNNFTSQAPKAQTSGLTNTTDATQIQVPEDGNSSSNMLPNMSIILKKSSSLHDQTNTSSTSSNITPDSMDSGLSRIILPNFSEFNIQSNDQSNNIDASDTLDDTVADTLDDTVDDNDLPFLSILNKDAAGTQNPLEEQYSGHLPQFSVLMNQSQSSSDSLVSVSQNVIRIKHRQILYLKFIPIINMKHKRN